MVKWLIPLVLLAAALFGLVAWSQWQTPEEKVSGVIEADEIRLGSRVGGRVSEVLVEEGGAVHAGQPLVRLEEFDLRQRLTEAQAILAQRKEEHKKLDFGRRPQEIAQAEAGFRQAEATVKRMERPPREEEVKAAKAQLRLAQAQAEQASANQRRLLDAAQRQPSAVSREELDRAEESVQVTRAAVEVREEELTILNLGVREEEREEARAARDGARAAWELMNEGFRDEEKAQAKAAVDAAQAAVEAIEEQLAELVIESSVEGRVEALELQPGDLVAPNAPVLSLMDTGHLWVRAYIPQRRLDIKVGDRLPVTVDAYPGHRLTGVVTFVSRQAEFTPSNVQTYDERAKQVFRVKITLDKIDDPEVKLYPGMTADVYLRKSA